MGGWGKDSDEKKADDVTKLKPDFAPSGALELERHTVNGIHLNYSEPSDARVPDQKWRLYVFKGDTQFGDPLFIHRQSAYVVGRERKIAHVPIDHPSCSKQHSVLQFRLKSKVSAETGELETSVRPYIIDLNSTNGTFLNEKRVDPAKYYELLEEDVLKFGHSTREYVLLKAEAQAGPNTLT